MIENLYPDRRWLVIPTSITSSINFDEVEEDSIENLRLSVDSTQTFIKYNINIVTTPYTQSIIIDFEGNTEDVIVEPGIYGRPSIYSSSYQEYIYPEILELLNTPEWTYSVSGTINY
jgi:hypothetical protein